MRSVLGVERELNAMPGIAGTVECEPFQVLRAGDEHGTAGRQLFGNVEDGSGHFDDRELPPPNR